MATRPNKLLVVDDDAISRRLLVRTLSAAGYLCQEAANGEEALGKVRSELPSALLLDYDMPGMNGAQVLRQLRADVSPAIAQLPTIMLTGHGGEESEIHCLEAGADDFVTKPIFPAVLQARIATQLRLRSLREQLIEQNEELEAWHQNREQDLASARRTQQSLIPQNPPALPGWEVASYFRPVIQVGGDIFGWLRMIDERQLFWIADATGHGAAAALLTTMAKLLFHHASVEHQEPAEIMERVDRDFRSILGARSFMTAMCVALNPETGEASVVGAGHPPLLLQRDNGKSEIISSEAPPLGLQARGGFKETKFQLQNGDLFLLYTDGLYGGANGQRTATPGDLSERLRSGSGSAASFLNHVLPETLAQNGERSIRDDIAALTVRRHRNGSP